MYIERRKLSKSEIQRISLTINIILIALFVILLFAFWNIQVLRHYHFNKLAGQNITWDIELKAPRGLILDRYGKRLSDNKLNFSLFLVREFSQDIESSIAEASFITGLANEEIKKKIEKFKFFPKSYKIPLIKDLPLKKAIYVESRSDEFPEFEIDIEPARHYPFKAIASHILGYISELTGKELERKKKQGYTLGDNVGKSGIERQYESYLRGEKGIRTVAKDNLGRIREVMNEVTPTIGKSIVLTIDIQLQEYIESLFEQEMGAVGVVDLKSGGLIAMVSRPNFNPEFFSGVLDPVKWKQLINDPHNPLQNKFLQGLYSPGSTFKIVVALAGLEENLIDPSAISTCYGSVKIYDRSFHCWQGGGHGAVNLYEALEHSCNVYFYRLGKKLDVDIIAKYANMLGLGKLTHIDLPNEKNGIVPTKAWKLESNKQPWYPGETISIAIGGGMLNVTPIQALTMISTVALRGKMPQIHLLKEVRSKNQIVTRFDPKFRDVPIARENFETVIEGLYRVVNENGTARSAKIPGLDICGKTGTQQVISKENTNYKNLVKQKRFKPHAWFVSFAPRINPKIAMVVFIENGGDAGAIAAPISAKIYRKIFFKKQGNDETQKPQIVLDPVQ